MNKMNDTYEEPTIYIDDFQEGDYLLVEAIGIDLGPAETLYRVEHISFELHVTVVTHLQYTNDSKFPNQDTWTGEDLNSDTYSVKRLDKNKNPEYFL